jgi:catechol 2,3-dioxygenase-like lactoylglutathione lyase family enzyme
MSLFRLTPLLYTRDLQGTVDFYTGTLGFSCPQYRPEWGWARLARDGADLMLSLPNDHLPFEGAVFTGSFYFYTDEVDGLWERWKDQVKIAYPIDDFDHGMREFAIYDNNGYMLQFGQEL